MEKDVENENMIEFTEQNVLQLLTLILKQSF